VTVQSSDLSRPLRLADKSAEKALIGGPAFDFLFLGGVVWFMTGSYLDAWAHNNIPSLETFFTPWHGVLYSGVLAIAVLLTITVVINRQRGASWLTAIPRGYELSAFFVFMMFFVGVGDGAWHTLFGIEKNIDGVLSPTHIAAMLCTGIIILGPYRALSSRKGDLSRIDQLILTLTITSFLALLTLITQQAGVYTRLWPLTVPTSYVDGQLLAVVSFILQGLLLTGVALVTLRRWRLPIGFFTCALTIVAIGMSFMQSLYLIDILVGAVSGLLLDGSYRLLQPGPQRLPQFRLFCVLLCCTMSLVYLLVVRLVAGPLIWTIHLTFGVVAICAMFGWLLSYVAVPPTQQSEA